jgi:hypothetical protein
VQLWFDATVLDAVCLSHSCHLSDSCLPLVWGLQRDYQPQPLKPSHEQAIVNRMRVRTRLNERRLGELLRGLDPSSLGDSWVSVTAGLLGCIGDIASLNFMPVFDSTGDANKAHYVMWSCCRLGVLHKLGGKTRGMSRC